MCGCVYMGCAVPVYSVGRGSAGESAEACSRSPVLSSCVILGEPPTSLGLGLYSFPSLSVQ